MSDSEARFPIAVIGTSADGMEALRVFFAALPRDAGVGFIVIVSPAVDGLAPVVRAMSPLRVVELVDGQRIDRDIIYMGPSGMDVSLAGGVARTLRRDGAPAAIDWTLRSLAEDQGAHAVGVMLLAGVAGCAGLRCVQAHGGLTLVQDPALAPSLQRAALTPHADYVQAPDALAVRLGRYADALRARGGVAVTRALPVILSLLRAGRDLEPYQSDRLVHRIARRMRLCDVRDADAYVALLRRDEGEVAALSRELLGRVTHFFRDAEAWEALRTLALVPLVAAADPAAPLRAWVAGCATGHAAYALAMLLLELFEQRARTPPQLQIFATDIGDQVALGREGIYAPGDVMDIAPERLAKFFVRLPDGRYQVNKALRACVLFAAQDVISDPPFSRLQLVICRDVLSELTPRAQHKVLGHLHFGLAAGGYLFLGSAETVRPHDDMFSALSTRWPVFQRVQRRVELSAPGAQAMAMAQREPQLREELQSVNEELTTVNAQLQLKVEELEEATADLQNLLVSTHSATLLLDTELTIRRFTPGMTELMRLLPSDVGRAITDLDHALTGDDLPGAARGVLATRLACDDEVRADDGRSFLRRISPYRSGGERVAGVLITLSELTTRKHAEDRSALVRLLSDAAVIANEAGDIPVALRAVVERVSQVLGFHAGHVWMRLSDADEALVEAGSWWLDPRWAELSVLERHLRGRVQRPGEGLAQSAAHAHAPRWTREVEREVGWLDQHVLVRSPIRSALAFPLTARGRMYGVIELLSRETTSMTDEHLAVAAQIGEQLSRVLERDDAERAMKRLAAELSQVEDRQRSRAAAVLHDEVGQLLAAARLKLGMLAAGSEGKLASELELASSFIDGALEATHSLTLDLAPPPLEDHTVGMALGWIARHTEGRFGLHVELVVAPDVEALLIEARSATTLYRALRELLHDVAERSGNERIEVRVGRERGALVVEVQGDGGAALAQSGGLATIAERLSWLDGRVDIQSSDGEGTTIALTVPESAL